MPTVLGKDIGPVGYGLMGLTWQRNPPSLKDSIQLLDTAIDAGANLFNGGEFYGRPGWHSCHLLHEYFSTRPQNASKVLLSIKGGFKVGLLEVDSGEENVRRSVDECNRVLNGMKKIDIFQCARVDASIAIEDTIAVLAQLVSEGKIGGIGLSEASASTIQRAHKIHPIAAAEVELSLWTPDVLHNGVGDTCAELGIPIVAYGPLSRGALTDSFASMNKDIPDHRRNFPKFQDEVLKANLRLTQEVAKLGDRKGCKTSQIALAWIRGLSDRRPAASPIIPIPGAEKCEWIWENCADVTLTDGEMKQLQEILERYHVSGDRYMGALAKLVDT